MQRVAWVKQPLNKILLAGQVLIFSGVVVFLAGQSAWAYAPGWKCKVTGSGGAEDSTFSFSSKEEHDQEKHMKPRRAGSQKKTGVVRWESEFERFNKYRMLGGPTPLVWLEESPCKTPSSSCVKRKVGIQFVGKKDASWANNCSGGDGQACTQATHETEVDLDQSDETSKNLRVESFCVGKTIPKPGNQARDTPIRVTWSVECSITGGAPPRRTVR